MQRMERTIPVDRVFLHHENPRHEPYETQEEVIDYLCLHENVLPLARDIVKHGLNPLERFAMLRDETADPGGEAVYVVGEGNRRVCAIKLLDDPDLAPPEQRESFQRLAGAWHGIDTIPAVVFDDREDFDLWLGRIHQGAYGGIGRKEWTADQKQRHSGSGKNRAALAVLDYAEPKGWISATARKGKLTTVQRYVGNPVFRETLGLDLESRPDEVCRTRPEEDFDLLVQRFVGDLLHRPHEVSSRSNKERVLAYARELSTTEGVSGARIEPEPIDIERGKARRGRVAPRAPRKRSRLPYEREIATALRALKSHKLESLYGSLGRVSLQENTPLLAVGAWAFFETLTAKAGRDAHTGFPSFLSKQRLRRYGLEKGASLATVRAALGRVAEYGNATKHHETAAAFNGEQLGNDLDTLKDLILECAKEAMVSAE